MKFNFFTNGGSLLNNRYNKNKEYYERACKVTCGGYQTASKSPLRFPEEYPIYATEGKGCKIKDINNNWYIDFVSGLGTSILGYSHPKIVDVATKQIKKGNVFSLENPIQTELSELLCDTIPSAQKCKFFRNGSDATVAAVKVARTYSEKDGVLMFKGNYHGNADIFTIHQDINYGVPDINKQFSYCIESDINKVKSFIDNHEDIACIITEPVTYEDRFSFVSYLRRICNEKGIVLIFDEIVTHLRDSIGGTQGRYHIIPDLTTISKGMSCGYSISALVGSSDIMNCFNVDSYVNTCFYSGSFHGDSVSMTVAKTCIEECVEQEVPEHIYNEGMHLKEEFNKLTKEKDVPVEMYGLPYRMILKYKDNLMKSIFLQETARHGLLFGNIIYINNSHTEDIINNTLDICDSVLDNISLCIEQGTVEESIIGRHVIDLNLRKV